MSAYVDVYIRIFVNSDIRLHVAKQFLCPYKNYTCDSAVCQMCINHMICDVFFKLLIQVNISYAKQRD